MRKGPCPPHWPAGNNIPAIFFHLQVTRVILLTGATPFPIDAELSAELTGLIPGEMMHDGHGVFPFGCGRHADTAVSPGGFCSWRLSGTAGQAPVVHLLQSTSRASLVCCRIVLNIASDLHNNLAKGGEPGGGRQWGKMVTCYQWSNVTIRWDGTTRRQWAAKATAGGRPGRRIQRWAKAEARTGRRGWVCRPPARRRRAGRLSGFADIELGHAGAQGAPVEPQDFGGAVLAADFPAGLFQHPKDVVSLNRFQGIRPRGGMH